MNFPTEQWNSVTKEKVVLILVEIGVCGEKRPTKGEEEGLRWDECRKDFVNKVGGKTSNRMKVER